MKAFWIAFLSLTLTLPAMADILWLKNGRSLEGKVQELPNGKIEIQQSFGSFSFSPDQVDRVEKAISLEEVVDEALKTLEPDDAEGLFELAQWSQEQDAYTLSRDLMEEVLAIDPDHAGAHAALGHRQFEGQWLSEEEFRDQRGEVLFRGEWVAWEERARILAQEDAHRDRAHQRAYREARLELDAERLRQRSRPPAPRYDSPSHGYPVTGHSGVVSGSYVPPGSHGVARPHQAPSSSPRASAGDPQRRPRTSQPRRRATGPRHHRGSFKHNK